MSTVAKTPKDYVIAFSGLLAAVVVLLAALGILALVGWFLVIAVMTQWALLAPALGIMIVGIVIAAVKGDL